MNKYTIRELKNMLAEAEETAVNEMMDILDNADDYLAPAEIQQKLAARGIEFNEWQIVANLHQIGKKIKFTDFPASRFDVIHHYSEPIRTQKRVTTRYFQEVTERGEIIPNGCRFSKLQETTEYKLR